jgi:DNA-binding MarR family transcriptional regulator
LTIRDAQHDDVAATRSSLPQAADTGMTAWRAFLHAHAAIMRRLESDLDADQNLSLADFDVLTQLSTAPDDGLRMSDLADRVLLSRSGMTRRVDRLEAAGLVQRRGCDADRRGAYAVLTASGERRLEAALPTHFRGVDEHFLDQLAPDEMACIADCMGRLAAHAGAYAGQLRVEGCGPMERAIDAERGQTRGH